MAQDLINNDLFVNGSLSAKTMDIPSGTIVNDDVSATADILATKVEHQHVLNYAQPNGTAIVAETRGLFICRGVSGAIVQLDAMITGAIASGGDRTVTIDVKKGNAASGYASILSATVQFNNGSALRTPVVGNISTTTLADGDSLIIEVTVAGAAGSQAQGLLATLTVREKAT